MIKKAKYVRNAKITDQSLGSIKLIRSTTIKAARVVSSNELSVHNLKHLNTINLSPWMKNSSKNYLDLHINLRKRIIN